MDAASAIGWTILRVARENEAAGAADAVAWWFEVVLAVLSVVTERRFCDPTTSTNAGGTPAP
jgi:hypothetical protein